MRLTTETLARLEDPKNDVFVSAVSPWEIEIKRQARRLEAPNEVLDEIEEAGFVLVPISARHAVAAGRLPLHHRDPFDRMLVAQAQLEGLTLVTRDTAFTRYQVAILPA